MKICYIYPGSYPGNVPFYVQTQELARLGAEVYAIGLCREGEPSEERVGEVSVLRILTQTKPGHGGYLTFGTFLLSAYRTLSKLGHLDIVHMSNLPGVSLFPLLARNRAHGWVFEIRSPPLHGRLRSWISNVRIRSEARAFDLTLIHRQAVGEAIFGHGPGRFVEYPIGVDFDHFRPGSNALLRENLGVYPTEKLLIYTGSVEPNRRLHKMLAGFRQASSLLGNLRLLVVGDGSDLPRLRTLADDMGIAERVHFQGYVSYPQMPAYMQAADIGLCYVPMTPWFDKAPVLKTLESLASGLPTIATATEGNREYISHGKNGWLVHDSPESIAEGICMLCRRDDLRLAFQNGRESIRAYDWKGIVRDIAWPAYSDLLGEKA